MEGIVLIAIPSYSVTADFWYLLTCNFGVFWISPEKFHAQTIEYFNSICRTEPDRKVLLGSCEWPLLLKAANQRI